MKSSLLLATALIGFGAAIAFFGTLFAASSAPALIGGVVCGGVLWVAFSDYARKPRFRARTDREPARHVQTRSTLPDTDAALLWTYTTHSA